MNEPHSYGTKQVFPRIDNSLQFRLSRIREIKRYSSQKSKRHKKLVKYLTNALQHKIMLTRTNLFCHVEAKVFLFAHLLLLLMHLLG